MWTMILTVGKHFFGLMDGFVRALGWVWLVFCLALLLSLKAANFEHNRALQKITQLQQSIAVERESAAKTAMQMRDQAALDGERKAADLTRQNANLTVANALLKKDITHAYANFGHTKPASAPADPHGGVVGGGSADACFGAEFGRLWNRANAYPSGEAAAPECGPAGAPCVGAAAR